MNKRMILYIQGAILLIEAAIMVLPIAAALIYREPSGIWFFYTALAAAIIGFAAMKLAKPRSKTIYAKEGLIAVAKIDGAPARRALQSLARPRTLRVIKRDLLVVGGVLVVRHTTRLLRIADESRRRQQRVVVPPIGRRSHCREIKNG